MFLVDRKSTFAFYDINHHSCFLIYFTIEYRERLGKWEGKPLSMICLLFCIYTISRCLLKSQGHNNNTDYAAWHCSQQRTVLHPKWHPIPYIVHCFWPWPIGLWSKGVYYFGNRVPFETQIIYFHRDGLVILMVVSAVFVSHWEQPSYKHLYEALWYICFLFGMLVCRGPIFCPASGLK